jgi:hypothetical protein
MTDVASRVRCKNAAVCRSSIVAPAEFMHPYLVSGLCMNCDVTGHVLDIVASADECPVCYEPMELGVKWNADSCMHRFCPARFHQMLYGRPRAPYEHVAVWRGPGANKWGYVMIHDDGSTTAERDDSENPMTDDDDSDDHDYDEERRRCRRH